MPSETVREFVHLEMDQEVRAIGGYYALTKEVRLPFEGREVLYITGYGVFDTSCCGAGGCSYAIVPGFVREWKIFRDKNNRPVSRVVPIADPKIQKEVRSLIQHRELVQEVRFE